MYTENILTSLWSSRNVVHSCKYHVVWCPKYRRKVLVDGIDERLKAIICSAVAERDAAVIEMEVMPDHVHLLVEVDPKFGIHRLVRLLKGRSSRLRNCRPTLWTNHYSAATGRRAACGHQAVHREPEESLSIPRPSSAICRSACRGHWAAAWRRSSRPRGRPTTPTWAEAHGAPAWCGSPCGLPRGGRPLGSRRWCEIGAPRATADATADPLVCAPGLRGTALRQAAQALDGGPRNRSRRNIPWGAERSASTAARRRWPRSRERRRCPPHSAPR